MKLQRILAKDSRSANEQAIAQYGRDVLIVSNSRVNGMTELIVAVDVEPEKMPPPMIRRGAGEQFEASLRQQIDPAPAPSSPRPTTLASAEPSAPEAFVPAQMALMQAAQRAAAQTLGQSEPLRPAATPDMNSAAPAATRPTHPAALGTPAAVATAPAAPLRFAHQFQMAAGPQPLQASFRLPAITLAPTTTIAPATDAASCTNHSNIRATPAPVNSVTPAAPLKTAVDDDHQALPIDSDANPRVISSDKAHALTDLIRAEIAQLRKEMRMGQQLQAWAAQGPSHRWNEALADVGVPTTLRALLMSGLSNDWDDDQALASIEAQMAENLPSVATSGRAGRNRRTAAATWSGGVHLLSGPSGSGKTSMAARLAHEAAQRLGVERVVLVSWNDNRPGAWGQLQLWASRIGVTAFRAVDSGTLDLLLQENRGSLVIVDSGLNQPDILNAAVQGLNACLHLVMPADANAATLRRWVGEQAPAWTDVLITRLDESAQPWPLLQACCEHHLTPSMASEGSGLNQLRQPYDAQALLQHGIGVLASVLGAPLAEAAATEARHHAGRLEIPTIDCITTTVPTREAGRSGRSSSAAKAASAQISHGDPVATVSRGSPKATASARTRSGASHA